MIIDLSEREKKAKKEIKHFSLLKINTNIPSTKH